MEILFYALFSQEDGHFEKLVPFMHGATIRMTKQSSSRCSKMCLVRICIRPERHHDQSLRLHPIVFPILAWCQSPCEAVHSFETI
jgi:hypothetical protein